MLRVRKLGTCQIFEERIMDIVGSEARTYHPVYEPNLMIQPLGTTPFKVFMQVKIKKRLKMWIRAKNGKQSSLGDRRRYVIRDQNERKKNRRKERKEGNA